MSETNKQLPARIDPIVERTLIDKRDALLAEREKLREKQTALAARDRQIDRELADCQAAGRVFGLDIKIPRDETERTTDLIRWFSLKNSDDLKPAEKAVVTKAEMPRIRDIVLDRLKEAGTSGIKAISIQQYIERTYGKKIHDKTVGMTLYRLSKEGSVVNRGRTWFIVDQTMNPGGDSPGLEDRSN